MRRIALILLAAVTLAACGGSSHNASSDKAPPTTTVAPEAAITQAWTSFFNAATPPAQAATYLENGSNYGSQFAALLKLMPPGLTSKVHSVSITGPTTAMVTYELDGPDGHSLLGRPSSGTAVQVNGHWLVSAGTFCGWAGLAGVKCPH